MDFCLAMSVFFPAEPKRRGGPTTTLKICILSIGFDKEARPCCQHLLLVDDPRMRRCAQSSRQLYDIVNWQQWHGSFAMSLAQCS
jgi:hypothetical protein